MVYSVHPNGIKIKKIPANINILVVFDKCKNLILNIQVGFKNVIQIQL